MLLYCSRDVTEGVMHARHMLKERWTLTTLSLSSALTRHTLRGTRWRCCWQAGTRSHTLWSRWENVTHMVLTWCSVMFETLDTRLQHVGGWLTVHTFVFVRVDDFPTRYKLVRTARLGLTATLTQCFYIANMHIIGATEIWLSCMVGYLNIKLMYSEYFETLGLKLISYGVGVCLLWE